MKPSMASGIIVLVVAGYLGYHSAYVRPGQERGRIAQQLKEAQQAQEQRVTVASLLGALEQQRKHLAQRPDSDWLLHEVARLAQDAGVEVLSISPQPPLNGDEAISLGVALQCVSSYHQLGHFLSRIEHAERFIRVDELNVTREQGSDGRARAQLVLSTLYMSPVLKEREGAHSP